MTSMPNTTFSQNNGVIALTRCASRRAGIACACWLIVFGILAKVCVGSTSSKGLNTVKQHKQFTWTAQGLVLHCVKGGETTATHTNLSLSGVGLGR